MSALSSASAAGDWCLSAAAVIRQRLARGRFPWQRGLWLSARTSYRHVPLPRGFRLSIERLGDEQRRIVWHGGHGRPVVVLPGLYADLHEALFCETAGRLAGRGRPVILVEDRLAGPTLALNGYACGSITSMSNNMDELLERIGEEVECLAFSAGAVAALGSSSPAIRRMLAWSPVVDPAGTLESLSGLAYLHYGRLHRQAYRLAAHVPPMRSTLASMVRAWRPSIVRPEETLLVHAVDDPVVAVESLRRFSLEQRCSLEIAPGGSHLGFGVLAGDDLHIEPLLDAE